MSCFLEEKDGTVNVMLGFRRDELLYDIRNCAYIEGHVAATEDVHVRHTIQDAGEEGNVDRITRVLDLSVSQCKEMLYPYTKHEIHRFEWNDRLREPETYGIALLVPQSFSQTTLNLLEKLVHEYIVCMAVAEWMRITYPAKAATWADKALKTAEEIRMCLHTRRTGIRRKMHPF